MIAAAVAVLAAATPTSPSVAPNSSPNPNDVQPGLIGLVCFVALAVATYFLWRSMNKQLKRVDDHFAEAAPAAGPMPASPPPVEVPANPDRAAAPEPGEDGQRHPSS